MTDRVKLNLVILWEDEIRIASKLLKLAQEASENDAPAAAQAAYAACMTALWGINDNSVAVMLASSAILPKRSGND